VPTCPSSPVRTKAAGNRVIGIIGARNASLIIVENEMRSVCDEFFLATDDGSRGFHGFAADVLKQVMAKERVDRVWIIGPAIMMKVTSEATRAAGIRTLVSLNPDHGRRYRYVRFLPGHGRRYDKICLCRRS